MASEFSLEKVRVAQASGFGSAFGSIPLLHGNGPKLAGELVFKACDLFLIFRPVDRGGVAPGCEPDMGDVNRHLFTSQYSCFAPSFLRGCARMVQIVKLTLCCVSHIVQAFLNLERRKVCKETICCSWKEK